MERSILIPNLLDILTGKKLKIEIINIEANAFTFAIDVWAKPGAKVEKVFVSLVGALVIQTKSKPIDGEANEGIIEDVSATFGVSKSQVQIVRGEKSRSKRIRIHVQFTANKKEAYFNQKFSEILTLEA
jgi:uncharacterized protein